MPVEYCYVCRVTADVVSLLPTIDERLWICAKCDDSIRRTATFKPVQDGLTRLAELEHVCNRCRPTRTEARHWAARLRAEAKEALSAVGMNDAYLKDKPTHGKRKIPLA